MTYTFPIYTLMTLIRMFWRMTLPFQHADTLGTSDPKMYYDQLSQLADERHKQRQADKQMELVQENQVWVFYLPFPQSLHRHNSTTSIACAKNMDHLVCMNLLHFYDMCWVRLKRNTSHHVTCLFDVVRTRVAIVQYIWWVIHPMMSYPPLFVICI